MNDKYCEIGNINTFSINECVPLWILSERYVQVCYVSSFVLAVNTDAVVVMIFITCHLQSYQNYGLKW